MKHTFLGKAYPFLFITLCFCFIIPAPSFALNLGGASSGYSVILPKDWRLLTKDEHAEIAEALCKPYDPDGKAGLSRDVQAAVFFGKEPANFRQITLVPIPYASLPDAPEEIKRLSTLDSKAIKRQKEAAEQGLNGSGMRVSRSGILQDGFWILGSVNDRILQEVQMRYTKKGVLMILLFAGGTDKKAEKSLKSMETFVTINPTNKLATKKKK